MDTQWPRFQVFVQEQENRPHEDAGSVHAPDTEMALQYARDVFVRRPECVSLWVAPAEAIFSRTAEELEQPERASTDDQAGEAAPTEYSLFHKTHSAGKMRFACNVTAASPEAAMQIGAERFAGQQAFAWWVIPTEKIVHSLPQEAGSLFTPARDKRFRMAADFKTHSMMRQIKTES